MRYLAWKGRLRDAHCSSALSNISCNVYWKNCYKIDFSNLLVWLGWHFRTNILTGKNLLIEILSTYSWIPTNDPEQDLHNLFKISITKIRLKNFKNRVMSVHFCWDIGLWSLYYLTQNWRIGGSNAVLQHFPLSLTILKCLLNSYITFVSFFFFFTILRSLILEIPGNRV